MRAPPLTLFPLSLFHLCAPPSSIFSVLCSAVQCFTEKTKRRKKTICVCGGKSNRLFGEFERGASIGFYFILLMLRCCCCVEAISSLYGATQQQLDALIFFLFTILLFHLLLLLLLLLFAVCVCVCVWVHGVRFTALGLFSSFFNDEYTLLVAGPWPLAFGCPNTFIEDKRRRREFFLFLACVCSHKSIKQEKRPPPPPQLSPFRYFIYSTYVRILAPRELRNDCSSSFFLLCYYIGVREAVESSTWSLRRKDPFPRFSFFFFFFFFFLCAIPSHCVASFKWLPFFIRPIH